MPLELLGGHWWLALPTKNRAATLVHVRGIPTSRALVCERELRLPEAVIARWKGTAVAVIACIEQQPVRGSSARAVVVVNGADAGQTFMTNFSEHQQRRYYLRDGGCFIGNLIDGGGCWRQEWWQ